MTTMMMMPSESEHDSRRAIQNLDSIVNTHYKELLDENAENRRRARESQRLLRRKEAENAELQAHNDELQARLLEMGERLSELEGRSLFTGKGYIPKTGSSWTRKDQRAEIDVDNCSIDMFVDVLNNELQEELKRWEEMPQILNDILIKCKEENENFKSSGEHAIDFFNQESLQWREGNRMKTSDEELARPLEDAAADGINEIKKIMASRNVEGGEFQKLAAMLEKQFIALAKILEEHPLGDQYFVNLLTVNLLAPVHQVLNAEYRNVRVERQKEYVSEQQECEQLAKDRDDLWRSGEEKNDVSLKMESVEREVQLYKKLVDCVLAINSEIRALIGIGSDDCVERTLQKKMEVFIENSEKSIEQKQKEYDVCLGTYLDDRTHLEQLEALVDEELKRAEEASLEATAKYEAAMDANRAEKEKHLQELVDLIKRESDRRRSAFDLSGAQEIQIRRLDLHKKSTEHVKVQIHQRLDQLDKYNRMMEAGVRSLEYLSEITKLGIPGLLDHIQSTIDGLAEDIDRFEHEFLSHHQQAYLIVSSFIVKHGQRILTHERGTKTLKAEIQRYEMINLWDLAQAKKDELESVKKHIDSEEESREKVYAYLKKIDTPQAKQLYKKHRKPYPAYLAKRDAFLMQANLDAIELELIAYEEEWKQQVLGNTMKLQQIGYKSDIPNRIEHFLAHSRNPMFLSVTDVPRESIDRRREDMRKQREEMERGAGEDELKHDYESPQEAHHHVSGEEDVYVERHGGHEQHVPPPPESERSQSHASVSSLP